MTARLRCSLCGLPAQRAALSPVESERLAGPLEVPGAPIVAGVDYVGVEDSLLQDLKMYTQTHIYIYMKKIMNKIKAYTRNCKTLGIHFIHLRVYVYVVAKAGIVADQ